MNSLLEIMAMPEIRMPSVGDSFVRPQVEAQIAEAFRERFSNAPTAMPGAGYGITPSNDLLSQMQPSDAPYALDGPSGGLATAFAMGDDPVINALFAVESSSSLDNPNWQIRGPTVPSGMYAGERAIGPAQIMPGNIPEWSERHLGRRLDPDALARGLAAGDPQAKQDYMAIVRGEIDRHRQAGYSPTQIASIWHSGTPHDRGARDLATGIPTHGSGDSYISRFARALR